MFPKIIAQTYTISDLQQKLQFLKMYLKLRLFTETKDTPESPKEKFNSEDLIWLDSLPPDTLKGVTTANLDKTFADLEAKVKAIKPLVLMVATELPKKTIAEIANRLRHDYGPNFLIDVKVDPNLIAGCALVWNGNLKDYSLKAKVEAMRNDILAIFKTLK